MENEQYRDVSSRTEAGSELCQVLEQAGESVDRRAVSSVVWWWVVGSESNAGTCAALGRRS